MHLLGLTKGCMCCCILVSLLSSNKKGLFNLAVQFLQKHSIDMSYVQLFLDEYPRYLGKNANEHLKTLFNDYVTAEILGYIKNEKAEEHQNKLKYRKATVAGQ